MSLLTKTVHRPVRGKSRSQTGDAIHEDHGRDRYSTLFSSTTVTACDTFKTDNTRMVSDNTVTTPPCLDRMEGGAARVSTSSTNGLPSGELTARHRDSGCVDVEIATGFGKAVRISGDNTKSRHVSRHQSPMSRSLRNAVRLDEIPASAGTTEV